MTPTPTNTMRPPVMENIYKKAKVRRDSRDVPAYVFSGHDRKKSNSFASLLFEEEELDGLTGKQTKSDLASHMKSWCDDDLAVHVKKHRYSDNNSKKLQRDVFNYDRLLHEERNEFKIRLANIPKAIGKLEDFRLLKRLGCGNFGKIYLVQDFMEKKNYAMKAISKEVILRNDLSHDIETERDYLYAAKSPFIVSLIHHFEDSQRVYFIMEYLNNGDLYEHLKQNGPFGEELARFYAAQIILAFEYLHNLNLIYRDLKPENVMIDSNGFIKLVDFGFVKHVTSKTDTMVGTPAYMAPEVILHKPYNQAVDWWSTGILIYEMLSGCQVTPFADSNRMEMYVKITSKEVAFSNKFPNSSVRDLIKRLLKHNPSIRLGSGSNGAKDVKNHPWFTSMKWDDLYRRKVKPPTKSSNNLFTKSNCQQNIPKHQKVTALKQSLLGMSPARPDTIQNRVRLERLMRMY